MSSTHFVYPKHKFDELLSLAFVSKAFANIPLQEQSYLFVESVLTGHLVAANLFLKVYTSQNLVSIPFEHLPRDYQKRFGTSVCNIHPVHALAVAQFEPEDLTHYKQGFNSVASASRGNTEIWREAAHMARRQGNLAFYREHKKMVPRGAGLKRPIL